VDGQLAGRHVAIHKIRERAADIHTDGLHQILRVIGLHPRLRKGSQDRAQSRRIVYAQSTKRESTQVGVAKNAHFGSNISCSMILVQFL
jgi:hypothetical protein